MVAEAYLLDSGAAGIASHQGHRLHQEVRALLDSIGDDAVFISAVSVAESEYGLNLNPLPDRVQRDIRSVMASYQVLPIDRNTALVYGKIRAVLFNAYAPRDARNRIGTRYLEDLRERTSAKDLGIQENDLWIVSAAVQFNLVFVTADNAGGMRRIIEAANYSHRTLFLS